MPIDAGGGQGWVAIGGLAVPLLVLTVFFFLGLELLADSPFMAMKGAMTPSDGHAEAGHSHHRTSVVVGGALS